jgi:hypothetical protein
MNTWAAGAMPWTGTFEVSQLHGQKACSLDHSTPSQTIIRVDAAIARRVGEDTLILDLTNQRYLSLNRVGSFVWDLLEEETTGAKILEAMVEAFDADVTLLDADLQAFLTGLREAGLITITDVR